jgi:RNA 2',3'-cyclic 3'-phosphodiesterase
MRCFVSIEIPESLKGEIVHVFEKLETSGLVSGNFVKKENLHLISKFLGELSEAQIKKVSEKLREINFSSFNVYTDKIGFFPSEDYVRVIWLGLESERLFELNRLIDDKLSEIGISKDEREFSSHITVARIKSVRNKGLFLKKLKQLKIKKQDLEVDKISLIKSELYRSGPVYKILEEFDLKKEYS